MKMTPPLGRIICVCLCVAVVWGFPQFSVECMESHQGGPTHLSSQDVSSENDQVETSDHHKNEETWLPPAPLSSESVQLTEADPHSEAPITESSVENQHVKAPGVERAAEENLNTNRRVSQLEETSVPPPPAALTSEYEDISVNDAPRLQDPPTLNSEDEMKNSGSFSDSAAVYESAPSEVTASDLPPSECEEENPYDNDSSPPLVLENTSNAHTTGTKSHTDPPLSSPASHGPQPRESNTSHMLAAEQEMRPPVTTETDLTMSSKDPEDIPTFDEWKRKMMEVEKEKTVSAHNSNNGALSAVKKAQKNFNNYASVECGAKILGANPEAKSTSAILKENMDLYMLNPCGNKIWFIIELCEPIQLKQLDIANFELFSSTPKDFLVSISDRYPTNKWLKLGTFHGRDERTVQSFPLDEHLYAKYVKRFTKYIKVELISHFGSEHFCPLSLIRVFGTSMVEEYEEIAEPSERPDDSDDDLDSPSGLAPGDAKLSKNLIGSAKDAILNMVNNIAVNVLGGNPEMPGNLSHKEGNESETSTNLQTTVETATKELSSIPEKDEVGLPSDTVGTTTGPTEEMPAALNGSTDELGSRQEVIVIPLEADEEEPISSSIILLDKEEDLEEDIEKMNQLEQEKQIYPPGISSLTFSCSYATSLHEYLQQKCSASLTTNRKCQTVKKTQTITPSRIVPWYLPLAPSGCSSFQNNHNEPHERKEVLQEPESDTTTPKTLQPAGIPAESMSEALQLEPSLITTTVQTSATEPPLGKLTHPLETPSLSLEEPVKDPEVMKNQGILNEGERTESSTVPPSIVQLTPSVGVPAHDGSTLLKETKPIIDATHVKTSTVGQTQVTTIQSPGLPPTTSAHPEPQSEQTGVSGSDAASVKTPHLSPEQVTELLEPSGLHSTITDAKAEDLSDSLALSADSNSAMSHLTSSSSSDIYAEAPNGTEQNGNLVHSSNQKESVFMRLNNRIKALEMNMSLSGRYLEQLSQRYRKQMEEMQRAFNKTIIKLQNTSQIAEEQDQRQTESIQLLQGQLENVTQLVLNLSVRVSQLQSDVLDRQNYLLLSLTLCLGFGLLLCAYNCWISPNPVITEPEPPSPKSYTYCHPDREFSCDETGLKRSASFPLIHSESLQLATTDGLERLHSEEALSLCLTNKKRKRRKMKSLVNMVTLKPSLDTAGEMCNGAVLCNGAPVTINPIPQTRRLLHPSFRDSPSEVSSEASSHSDDPSFCGITTACSRFCDGLPVVKTRAGKRALRRRRPKPSCVVVDLLQAS